VKGGEDRLDDIGIGHLVGIEGRGCLFHDPSADRRIVDSYARPVDPMSVGRLNYLEDPRTVGIHPVCPVMITNRLAVFIDLAEIDMDKVDRRIGFRPFARQAQGLRVVTEGHDR
jgi:hypothetical protein